MGYYLRWAVEGEVNMRTAAYSQAHRSNIVQININSTSVCMRANTNTTQKADFPFVNLEAGGLPRGML